MTGMKTADSGPDRRPPDGLLLLAHEHDCGNGGPAAIHPRGAGGMTDDGANKAAPGVFAYNVALYNMQKANPKVVAPGGVETQLQFSLPFRAEMVKTLFPPDSPRRIR